MAEVDDKYDELIRQIIPINELPAQVQDEFIKKSELLEFGQGDYVFKKGDQDGYAYYLLEGEIELQGEIESNVVIGGTKGSRYAMAQLQPRQFNALVQVDSLVLQIERSQLDSLIVAYEKEQADSYGREADVNVSDVEISDSADGEDVDWMIRMLQSELFSRLPTTNIHTLFALLEPLNLKAGDVVINQGDTGEHYYIIQEGHCRISRKPRPDSKDITLAVIGPGDSFGEEALFTDNPRNATVAMKTDGIVMQLSKNDFFELIKKPLLQEINYDDALCLVEIGNGQWIDVRYEQEHRESAIEDSKNIPLNMLRMQASKLPGDKQYIVYCDTGGRSLSAAFLMTGLGYDVCALAGGLAANPQAVKAVVTEQVAEQPRPEQRQAPVAEASSKNEAEKNRIVDNDSVPVVEEITEQVEEDIPDPVPEPEPVSQEEAMVVEAQLIAMKDDNGGEPKFDDESAEEEIELVSVANKDKGGRKGNEVAPVDKVEDKLEEQIVLDDVVETEAEMEVELDDMRIEISEGFGDTDTGDDVKPSILESELERTDLKLMDTGKFAQIAEDRGMKLAHEALEEKLAKERIRIEVAKEAAEMEAQRIKQLQEASLARKVEETEELLRKHRDELEELHRRQAEEAVKLDKARQESEILLKRNNEKLEQTRQEAEKKIREARIKMEEAKHIKLYLEKQKAELLRIDENNKAREQELQQKQNVQDEAKRKLEEERRLMAERIVNHQKQVETYRKAKDEAEAAREATRKEAQDVITKTRAVHEKDKAQLKDSLSKEKKRLEAEQLNLQETLRDIQRMKKEAELAKQKAIEEANSLKKKQQQLELNMDREIQAKVQQEMKKAEAKLHKAQELFRDIQRMKKEAELAKQKALEEADSLKKKQQQLELNMDREIQARVQQEMKKTEAKLQKAQETFRDIQRMKKEAELAKQKALEEADGLRKKQQQLELNMDREIRARVQQEMKKAGVGQEAARTEKANIRVVAAKNTLEQDLIKQRIQEEKMRQQVKKPAAEKSNEEMNAKIISHQEKMKRLKQSVQNLDKTTPQADNNFQEMEKQAGQGKV